jgi:hypothetical protein
VTRTSGAPAPAEAGLGWLPDRPLIAACRSPWAAVPAVAWLALAAITVAWLAVDRAPLVADQVAHVSGAIEFTEEPRAYLTRERQFYPPLWEALTGAILVLTNWRLDSAVAVTNLAALALLLGSTYAIGCLLASPRVGALASALLAVYPAVYVHARAPMLDVPLAAFVAAAVLCLLSARGFTDRRWSLAFGLVSGLGWLTKQAFVADIALPLLVVSLAAPRRHETAMNAAMAIVLFLAIALPWYIPRVGWFLGDYADIQRDYAHSRGDVETMSLFGLAYYVYGTWHQTTLVLALAAAAALPLAVRRRRSWLPVAWWLGVVLTSTPIALKDTRFLLPALPAVALVTAMAVVELPLWRPTLAALLAFAAVQLWAASFGLPGAPDGPVVFNRAEPQEDIALISQNYRLALNDDSRADRSGWGIADATSQLRGRVAVVGHSFVFYAIRMPAGLRAKRTGVVDLQLSRTTCADARRTRFDAVVVQVGGPDGIAEGDAASCAPGLMHVREAALDAPQLLPGAHRIIIFER